MKAAEWLQTRNDDKEREHRCLVCGSQYTESPGGDLEYGHNDGCPLQPAECCHGDNDPAQVVNDVEDDAVLVGGHTPIITISPHACPTCHDAFETRSGLKQHHVRVHDRRLVEIHQCEWCDDWFVHNPENKTQQYCSRDCQNRSRRNRVTKTCAHCGDEFEVRASKADRRSHCSTDCQYADPATYEGRVTGECVICGDEWETWRNEADTRQYCSRECAAIGRRERVTVTCAHCGNDFEVAPSKADRRKHCSLACRHAEQDTPPEVSCS